MTRQRLFASIAGLGVVVNAQAVVHACPVCFRIEDGPTIAGVRAAVFVLIGVTTSVLACVAVFIARFAQRERRLHSTETLTTP